jgi:YgiT-type zinc finger domain-containing protein
LGVAAFPAKTTEEVKKMTDRIPRCSEHGVSMTWGTTTFEYEDDGIIIRIPHVPAWVCPLDGEASFTPEVTDELIAAVRELMASAKRARQQQPQLREYLVQFA